jgi:hypothetical protein
MTATVMSSKKEKGCYMGVGFWTPCVNAFQSYLSRLPLSRTEQSRVPRGTENINYLVFVIC